MVTQGRVPVHNRVLTSSLQLQNVQNRALLLTLKNDLDWKQTCNAHPAKPSSQNLKTSSRSPAHSDAQIADAKTKTCII